MRSGTSLSARISGNIVARYALAVVAVVTALLICDGLTPFHVDRVLYVILFPAVAFSAWYCGIGPSIMALVVALAGARYWFTPPIHSFRIPNFEESISALAFLFSCGVVLAMGEARRRDNENIRRSQGELEDRVRERTAELDTANHNLRELSARLLQLQDEERRRIARELHDSIGQMLTALTMNLSSVRADIERLAKTATSLTDSEGLVQAMSTEVRTISYLLHPPLLDEKGLSSAIRWYVDGFTQRSKIKVDLDLPDDFGRLPREVETALFRVVQECLTNVHRHSGSSVAKIRVRQSGGQVIVEVADEGKGIAPEKKYLMASAATHGVGVRGMRERLRQLGGSLEIDSTEAGTVVIARLPIAQTCLPEDTSSIQDSSSTAVA
jgi:signal transduction histidine kinase